MRKHYPASFKTKVVLEVLREESAISQIASKYGVHPVQISKWKAQVLDRLPSLLERKNQKQTNEIQSRDKTIQELYNKIGRLTTQVD